MKSLLTGGSGFIGVRLYDLLIKSGDSVEVISRSTGGDVLDKKIVNKYIKKLKPDRIFHLAAQSNIQYSFFNPEETIKTNVLGTLNLLDAIRIYSSETFFLSFGSSAEYGSNKTNKLWDENSIPSPNSPYAISKLTQYYLVRNYKNTYGINTVHARLFSIIGPGKEKDAVSDFTRGIVEVEQGRKKYLEVGTISNIRDFLDVRDAVWALELLSKERLKYDVYNICSGKPIKLSKILNTLIKMAKKKISVKVSASKKRLIDDKVIVGNSARLKKIGFKQKYTLEESLEEILNYWRKKLT